MSTRIKAHLALFSVALIYGANYTIAKFVLDDGYIKPLGFILLRIVTGMILFIIIHQVFIKEKIKRKDIPLLVLCGLFGAAINQMFFFMGLEKTTPINASLIMTTTPIMVLLIGSVMLKEKITSRKVLGVLIGACGAVILILYGQKLNFNRNGMLGDFMVMINAISYAIYLVLVKYLMKKYHPITVVKWVFVFGAIFAFPFGIGQLSEIEWASFTSWVWIAVAYVLIFTTFFAYLLNAFALKTVQASTASTYIYLQPLLATMIAVLVASDHLAPLKVISGILIFIGVYLVSSTSPASKQKRMSQN